MKDQLLGLDEFSNFKGGNQGTNLRATKEQYDTILQMITTNPVMKQASLPLNQILYGPPGTGKTYHTVNKALEIIHGSEFGENKDRSELLKEFNQLKEDGRVGFVTFHQSFSYEDFVEGIKPIEPDKVGDPVIYRIEDGMFKKICVESAFSVAMENESNKTENVLDFSLAFDQFVQELEERLSSEEIVELNTKNGGKVLVDSISPNGNVVIKHHGGSRTYTVSKSRTSKLQEELKDLDDVNNINNQFRAIIGGSNSSAYWAVLNSIRNNGYKPNVNSKELMKYTWEDKKQVVQFMSNEDFSGKKGLPFVLIIDEINRGNIASIFGELITLIEPDKRLGNPEELQAQIPYSKEWFGVPSNLYIIGTMNTADRSVEALDTALRRRFSFEEMLPRPELVSPNAMLARLLWDYGEYKWDDPKYKEVEQSLCNLLGADASFDEIKYDIWDSMEKEGFNTSQVEKFNAVSCTGINLEEILNTINSRIEALVDRDHTIGHSYFMNVKSENDLRLVFKDKIVPLLQEYFFGDFGKIGLVLGPEFVEQFPEEVQFAEIKGYEETSHLQRERYRLKTIDDQFDIKEALDSLLNKKEPQT